MNKDYDWSQFEGIYPLIIKPVDGAHGHGVQMGIRSLLELQEKLTRAWQDYPVMMVQEEIQ